MAIAPKISISQNGSDVQEARNLPNQAKVCHCEPIEKLASCMSLQTRAKFQIKN